MSYSPKTGQGVKVDFRPAISRKELWYDPGYKEDVRRGHQGAHSSVTFLIEATGTGIMLDVHQALSLLTVSSKK